MRAQVHYNILTNTYELYVWDELQDGRRQYFTLKEDGNILVRNVERGEPIEPMMRAPASHNADILKAISAAVTETLPADTVMQAHLSDAMKVRDRLLSIIERGNSLTG